MGVADYFWFRIEESDEEEKVLFIYSPLSKEGIRIPILLWPHLRDKIDRIIAKKAN